MMQLNDPSFKRSLTYLSKLCINGNIKSFFVYQKYIVVDYETRKQVFERVAKDSHEMWTEVKKDYEEIFAASGNKLEK